MNQRQHQRLLVGVALITTAAMVSCERSKPVVRSDSSASASLPASEPEAAAPQRATWIRDAGPILLVEGASPTQAVLLGPLEGDSLVQLVEAQASTAAITLIGRSGTPVTAHLTAAPEHSDAECTTWQLRDVKPDANGWSIGFMKDAVRPVAMDSVDVLSARDSMKLVADVSRLASSVTAPTDAAFQGLRFTAHEIRRFEASPGVQALVAHVIRRVNQEANPQEEQTLLIAERDSGATTGDYHLVYAERSWGLEEQVTTPEVVGGAIIEGKAALVVARDNDSGVAYAIIQRADGHHWIVRWISAPTSCS